MPVTEALAAKRALFDRLAGLAVKPLPLAGVQVSYAWPGRSPDRECVYGGGVRFTRESAGHDGRRELWLESAVVGLYVRVTISGAQVQETDERAVAIAGTVETLLQDEPRLAGGFTFMGITGGSADYVADDTGPISILAYQVQIQYYLD
jgi:hypothetical protein